MLSAEVELLVCLSKIRPRIQHLCKKGTSSSITLKVNFTMTLDVSFIFIFKFNFILTCYFDIFKGKIR
jgi:hypothetical protein